MESYSSDTTLVPSGSLSFSSFEIFYYFKPFEEKGGDRFAFCARGKKLFFYLADATGHGLTGAKFWERHRHSFDSLWQRWISSSAQKEDLEQCIFDLNGLLCSPHHSSSDQLCIALGIWGEEGTLQWANCGYGVHLLCQSHHQDWWKKPEGMFGLKLGWLAPEVWSKSPRAFVYNEREKTSSFLLLGDAFLGDDFENPSATLEEISHLQNAAFALPVRERIPYIVEHYPSQGDDASLLMVERK